MQETFNVSIIGHVKAISSKRGTILDSYNAIHPQNMARVIARALAKEPNYYIYRLAMGNGGTFTDSTGQTVFRPVNDGRDGSGWESRLWNEVYSEIVDETDPLVGTDPGSSDANGIRTGGGASPSDDAGTDSTVSQEVGTKSNVTVTMFLNENEPSGQTDSITDDTPTEFVFDEFGLYTSGKPARDSAGYSTVNVGNAMSLDNSILSLGATYNATVTVDGTAYTCVLKMPVTGTGSLGQITYGDICEGINSGTWILSGDQINNFVYVYITDNSGGTYPSIIGAQSYGFLTFESKTTGSLSSVALTCSSGVSSDFFNNISSGICGNVNFTSVSGANAGSANDPIDPTNERERLLTHIIFSPITKAADEAIQIIYTLTVSVNPSKSATVLTPST